MDRLVSELEKCDVIALMEAQRQGRVGVDCYDLIILDMLLLEQRHLNERREYETFILSVAWNSFFVFVVVRLIIRVNIFPCLTLPLLFHEHLGFLGV